MSDSKIREKLRSLGVKFEEIYHRCANCGCIWPKRMRDDLKKNERTGLRLCPVCSCIMIKGKVLA